MDECTWSEIFVTSRSLFHYEMILKGERDSTMK
jgi:hypothetical protein